MSSLLYLLRTEIKNILKELRRKPAKLIMYLLVVACIFGLIVLTIFSSKEIDTIQPMGWLSGIYFAFISMFVVISVQKGLTSGDAIFEMSDVNLMFVSPLNPRSILLYGLVRLAKVSFWAGFFILFQSTSLANFGVDFGGILLLFFVFIFTIMTLTLLSLVIYSSTNGNPQRKRWVRVFTAAIFLPLLIHLLTQLYAASNFTDALMSVLSSNILKAVPFAGWASGGAIALLEGDTVTGLLWLGLLLVAGLGMLAYIVLSRADYYEDVLVATETAFERKRAISEGDVQGATVSTSKVKVKKTGIGGSGASTFFRKHLREAFRENRLGFFGLYSIIVFACLIIISIVARESMNVITILNVLMWMQIFMIGNGRGIRELLNHYIYMVPVSAFQKVLWSNMELVFKTLIESILFFGVTGLMIHDNPIIIVEAMLTYTLFSLLLLSINYLSMRVSQTNISQGFLMLIYFFAVALIMAPGLIAALMIGFLIGGNAGMELGLLVLSAWELLAALICFALSRGVLHNCDMPTVKSLGK